MPFHELCDRRGVATFEMLAAGCNKVGLSAMRNRQGQKGTKSRQRLECVELAPAFISPVAPKAPARWTHSTRFASHEASRQRPWATKPE